jgi:hypothetical protein
MFVPHHQWLKECMALSRVNDQLDWAETNSTKTGRRSPIYNCASQHLRMKVFSVKTNSFASIAKKVVDKPLTGVPARPSLQSGTGLSSSS